MWKTTYCQRVDLEVNPKDLGEHSLLVAVFTDNRVVDQDGFSAVFGYPGTGNVKNVGLAGRHILAFSIVSRDTDPTNPDGVACFTAVVHANLRVGITRRR